VLLSRPEGFTASELETLMIVLGIELVFYVVLIVLMIVMYRVMKKVCDHNFGCSIKFFYIYVTAMYRVVFDFDLKV
jgi:hypothetical protein